MKNIHLYIIIALLVSTSVLGFIVVSKNKTISECENRQETIKKEKLKKVNDSILNLYDLKIKAYNKTIDSFKKVKQQIKYVPYEKYYYTDRTIDAALDIIAEYKYDTRTKGKEE